MLIPQVRAQLRSINAVNRAALHQCDEPMKGLHFEDIRLFISVMQKLVVRSNSVLVIGQTPDVTEVADYIVDMCSDGGKTGGGDPMCRFSRGVESLKNVYSRIAQGNNFGYERRAGFW